MASEIVRLRARVRELESELARRELPESIVVAESDLLGSEDILSPEQSGRLECATPAWR
ncbi:MAG: hypothetical protein Q8P61_00695 [Candidatus Nanopelagicales bacterium]|nr:hypothetical protein [Candidatus Nanopelagicales bacterium]